MENLPLISVIIPVYNVEQYLEECVNSVLKQTYKNIEIILVDDGSTDSSGSMCDSFSAENKNICVVHQKNGGLSAARNTGFSCAKGEYVYFLDSDDYIAEDALEKLCLIAEKDSSDIVFFDAHSFLHKSDEEIKQNYKRKNIYHTKSGIEIFEEMQKNGEFHSSVPLLFIRKNLFVDNAISFITDIYYEDMAFTFEALCLAKKVSQCTESLYFRRYRRNSIMTSAKNIKYFHSITIIYKHILQFTENNGFSGNSAVKEYMVRISYNVFNNYNALSKADKKTAAETFSEIKKDIIGNNAFDDKALKLKCHNDVLWFIYKGFTKVLG